MKPIQELEKRKFTGSRHFTYEIQDKNKKRRADAPTFEEWKELVLEDFKGFFEAVDVKYAAWIFHDKDKDSSKHCHFVIETVNKVKFKTVNKHLQPQKVTSSKDRKLEVLEATREGNAIRYLLHHTERAQRERKYPYSVSELIVYTKIHNSSEKALVRLLGDELTDWYIEKASKGLEIRKNKNTGADVSAYLSSLKEQVAEGDIHPDEVFELLKQEFGIEIATAQYKQTLENQLQILRRQYIKSVQNQAKIGRISTRLSNVYLSAPGGWGKTLFAKKMADYFLKKDEKNEREIFDADASSPQSNSIFSGYENQHITILNEIEYTMTQAQFCDGFDTFKATRNFRNRHNNIFNTSRYCIFTKSDSFELFTSTLGQRGIAAAADKADKIWQVKRRFDAVLEVEDGIVTIYKLNKETQQKEQVAQYESMSNEDILNLNENVIDCFEVIYKLCN